jgi:regulator of protease activity HflC (stomatin/prohibitin superfamily)
MKKVIVIMLAAAVLAGCGQKVEVPPAHVGKIQTKNGYAPDTIAPSKFRLPACWAYCDRLVLLEASDRGFTETMTLFMPKDKLNLKVDVRGTLTVPTAQKTVDALYDRLPAEDLGDSRSIIRAHQVYLTYGQQALRGIIRSELVKYTISEILEEREAISSNIHEAIRSKMDSTHTPLIVSRFELADIQPPAVIVEAQQAAVEREIGIQRAEADAQVEMVQAERALEVAKLDRLVEREKAEAIAEQNRIAAKAITPEILAYKRLETAQAIYLALAASDNTIIVPADSGAFDRTTSDAILAKMLGKELR